VERAVRRDDAGQVRDRLIIAQRMAGDVGDPSARALDHARRGADVPPALRQQRKRRVGSARRHPSELVGHRAAGLDLEASARWAFLQAHGVSTTFAIKIYRHYRERSIAVVKENPLPPGDRHLRHRVQDGGQDRRPARHLTELARARPGRGVARPWRDLG
jgi:hypothetical protein